MGSRRSPVAFVGVLVVLLLTVMGFAAFSAPSVESPQTSEGVTLSPTASGRIAAAALAAKLAKPEAAPAAPTSVATSTTDAPPEPVETTTTLPETAITGAAAQPAVTTTAPPATTAPPTTTTTAPPTTTTTAPPTTTTAPPTTTTTPPPPRRGVEQWRPLVAAYFPANQVESALVVMACESGGDPNAYNPGSGASGLFQFIPATWESARVAAGRPGADVFDPDANIAVAAWLSSTSSSPWSQWVCKP